MSVRFVTGPVIALLALSVATTVGDATQAAGRVVTCEEQSSANFRHAFTSRSNLLAGPFVLIGGRRLTHPDTVRESGGNKFPALVAAGRTVTVRVPRALRGKASLYYGDSGPDGERKLSDGSAALTFRSCSRRRAASKAGRKPVTFWSGFVFTDAPRCLRIRVWVDDADEPRTRRIPLGRRC